MAKLALSALAASITVAVIRSKDTFIVVPLPANLLAKLQGD